MSKQQQLEYNLASIEFRKSIQKQEVRAEVLSRQHVNQETVSLRKLKVVFIASSLVAAISIGEGLFDQNDLPSRETSSLYNAWKKIKSPLIGVALLGALGAGGAFARRNKRHTDSVEVAVHQILQLPHMIERNIK